MAANVWCRGGGSKSSFGYNLILRSRARGSQIYCSFCNLDLHLKVNVKREGEKNVFLAKILIIRYWARWSRIFLSIFDLDLHLEVEKRKIFPWKYKFSYSRLADHEYLVFFSIWTSISRWRRKKFVWLKFNFTFLGSQIRNFAVGTFISRWMSWVKV